MLYINIAENNHLLCEDMALIEIRHPFCICCNLSFSVACFRFQCTKRRSCVYHESAWQRLLLRLPALLTFMM